MRRLSACFLALLVPAFVSARDRSQDIPLRGQVLDATGGPVVAARVVVTPAQAEVRRQIVSTDQKGTFRILVDPGVHTVRVAAAGFDQWVGTVTASRDEVVVTVVLSVSGVTEIVNVAASPDNPATTVSSATRTATPRRDIPQSISVVSRDLIDDQRISSMADAVRFMPGVSMAQGEGNRDTPVIRGNSSTSDFFVDGIRDDVQYFRDVYNVERVEALKGPNAMIFGRGGAGGVINRVTRQADWSPAREFAIQGGNWNNRRMTADVGDALNSNVALRATGMYENSGSYRDGVSLERYGIQPSAAVRLGPSTTIRASYEHFHDTRTADRGIPSFGGVPVQSSPDQFFGNSDQSESRATVNAVTSVLEHRVGSRTTLRNRTSYAVYDKFYQNVFPGTVNASATLVALSAYNNATDRRNLFSQTDLIAHRETGSVGHTLMAGFEIGRQATDNFRETGFFSTLGPSVTSVQVPLDAPVTSLPITYRQSASDADNHGTATVAAVYAQDQIALSRHVIVVAGVRLDLLDVDFTNNRTSSTLNSRDRLVSPRAGLIYKPIEPVSFYGSYSVAHVPRAGEQLASLSVTNAALEPESFRNYEAGVKWSVGRAASVTAALYRLDRQHVAVPDPSDPTRSLLIDAQRTNGFETEVSGAITDRWTVAGGYAYQDGTIRQTISAAAPAGARLPHLPRHSASVWTRHQVTNRLGVAAGVVRRAEIFAATDNTVVLPAFTRVDAALFFDFLPSRLRAQLNVENLFDTGYYVSAHSNNNITPGAPRSARVALTARF